MSASPLWPKRKLSPSWSSMTPSLSRRMSLGEGAGGGAAEIFREGEDDGEVDAGLAEQGEPLIERGDEGVGRVGAEGRARGGDRR